MSEVVYEAPWLELEPMFYNVRTGAVDRDVSAVIDLPEVEIDPEGLSYYLDVGYSILGRTPVRGVRFVDAGMRLVRDEDGRLSVEPGPDARMSLEPGVSTVADVLELMRDAVADVVDDGDTPIVVPTSGGKDSTILNVMLRELGVTDRVRAFSFGTSDEQTSSTEVVRARRVAREVGVPWEHVELGEQHRFMDTWYDWFGPVVEAHGMYQIEFYRKVRGRLGPDVMGKRPLVLSGALGDWMAGTDPLSGTLTRPWERPEDVVPFFTHLPERATSEASRLPFTREAAHEFFEANRAIGEDPWRRSLERARRRTMLLRYLLQVPRKLGFAAAAPLIDRRLATTTLRLPLELRYEWRWERAFLAELGLGPDGEADGDPMNTLDVQALHRVPLRPLDVDVLRECIRPDYVRWVNRNVGRLGRIWEAYWRLEWKRGFRRASEWLRNRGVESRQLPAYYAYLILWPLERLLRARDEARAAVGRGEW